jgi:flagellar basal-body rod modification protein FlgD
MSTVDTSSAAFDAALAAQNVARNGATSDTPVATSAASQQLGQSDFLALLTAQLNNQDPFDPVKNEDMVAQMATFSTNAGISEMNSSLQTLATRMNDQAASQALNYVGKTVLVKGDTAYAQTGGGLTASVDLASAASAVEVTISDQAGNALRTLQLGQQKAGQVDFDWDGKTDSGATAPDGPYKITARAVTEGQGVQVPVLVWAPVTSVNVGTNGSDPTLNVAGLGAQPISAVRQVG